MTYLKYDDKQFTLENMPSCFSKLSNWKDWNRLTMLADKPKENFCIDCTPVFKQRMLEADRCEYPDVTFHEIKFLDGNVTWEGER